MFDSSSVRPLQPAVVRRLFSFVALGALVTVSACAARSAASRDVATSDDTRVQRYVISPAEMEKTKADNVYDVISKIRPEFLRGHGDPNSFVAQQVSGGRGDPGMAGVTGATAVVSAPQPVVAYHDQVRLSSVDDLKLMPITNVAEIRFIPGPQAGVKYGTNHSGGVILVTSK